MAAPRTSSSAWVRWSPGPRMRRRSRPSRLDATFDKIGNPPPPHSTARLPTACGGGLTGGLSTTRIGAQRHIGNRRVTVPLQAGEGTVRSVYSVGALSGRQPGRRGDFGGEVSRLLVDTLADGEADEAGQRGTRLLGDRLHPALAVMHPDLLQQHHFLVVFADLAHDHLLDDLGRLPGGLRLLRQHRLARAPAPPGRRHPHPAPTAALRQRACQPGGPAAPALRSRSRPRRRPAHRSCRGRASPAGARSSPPRRTVR